MQRGLYFSDLYNWRAARPYFTLTLKNTIVANSTGGNCSSNGPGSDGHNLSDDSSSSAFFTAIGDLNNTPAQLDPNGLQNNGSTTTQTIALLLTSPAVNGVPISPTNYCTGIDGTTPIATDQRGISRPQDFACDIGAFELQADPDNGLAVLHGSNTFTGNQTVNGNITATSFFGSGAGLTGVITGVTAGSGLLGGGTSGSVSLAVDTTVARTNATNTFIGNQAVNGTVAATAFSGNGSGLTSLSPANISSGTAAINISGTAAVAVNATNLGGVASGNYARLDVGNTFSGNQSVTGNVSASGNLSSAGSTTIGGGTPIVEHLSATFNPSFPILKPSTCASAKLTLTGASDGDTLALGVPNARTTGGGTILYFAWVSAANTVTVQGCNISATPQKTAGTGAIRVDLWKH